MGRFLAIRLTQGLLVLVAMSFLIYGLIGLMPGDPIDLMITANPEFTSEDAARLKALYGLDQPLTVRYGNWLSAALSGDLGYSRLYSQPVLDVIGPRLANTAILVGFSLILALLIAIPVGVVAAVLLLWRQSFSISNPLVDASNVENAWVVIARPLIVFRPSKDAACVGEAIC